LGGFRRLHVSRDGDQPGCERLGTVGVVNVFVLANANAAVLHEDGGGQSALRCLPPTAYCLLPEVLAASRRSLKSLATTCCSETGDARSSMCDARPSTLPHLRHRRKRLAGKGLKELVTQVTRMTQNRGPFRPRRAASIGKKGFSEAIRLPLRSIGTVAWSD
jgi:hypothetical protein